jgi:hypothetical protein
MLECYKGKYNTPIGYKYLSVKALSLRCATLMLKNKTPYKKGWYLEEVIEPEPNKETALINFL